MSSVIFFIKHKKMEHGGTFRLFVLTHSLPVLNGLMNHTRPFGGPLLVYGLDVGHSADSHAVPGRQVPVDELLAGQVFHPSGHLESKAHQVLHRRVLRDSNRPVGEDFSRFVPKHKAASEPFLFFLCAFLYTVVL